jgi:sialic acid synthase SpsE
MNDIHIGSHAVGAGHPTYIIAEIGSNFDGDLQRAKDLAKLSKDLGADAYKIQNFSAPKIVSNAGFSGLQLAFQAKWDRPVVEVYRKAEFPREWIKEVADYCKEIGIDFFSSPYDIEAVNELETVGVPAHKIGSGEIDNLEFLAHIARTGKPMLIGCGASTMEEIEAAVKTIRAEGNENIILLQCVTNYPSPIKDSNIRAMLQLKEKCGVQVGYSDHTIGKAGGADDPLNGLTVPLGAVALGACVIEKHFTDDRTRKGPDHPFAMNPEEFKNMVDGIRAMEQALGDGEKKLMPSEQQTVVIQRRGIYAIREIRPGDVITRDMVEFLRPAVGLRPPALAGILGKTVTKTIAAGDPIKAEDING